MVARFADDKTITGREQVAVGLYQRALTLSRLNRPLEALGSHDELIARFQTDDAAEVRKLVIWAVTQKVVVARALVSKGEPTGGSR